MLAQSGERQRSGKRRLREGKRGRQRTGIAREGFLDRRSKRCFWLLLSPQTKVARAGARNYPRRRQIMRLRRCAATPHPPPSGAPSPQGEGLRVRHSHREPLKGKADGGVSFNTATPQGEGLRVRHSHREPLKGKADGGVSFNTATPQGEGLRVRHSHREPLKGKADGGVSFNAANPARGRLGLVRPGHPSPCDLVRGKAWGCGIQHREHPAGKLEGAAGVQRKFTVFLQNLKVELRKASML